ncbi:MAG: DUF4276 family protein [Verrucomicrobiales bacterium]|nr:DUF4276 family protein [Verrucomicrobiales bacterium]
MIQKLGLVLECCREGADERVLRCLVRRLSPDTQVVVRAMNDKGSLFREGIQAAEALVTIEKCDRVFVVWDLHPEWEDELDPKRAIKCKDECEELRKQLAKVEQEDSIDLICIIKALETWVLADERALSEYFSTPSHPASIPRIRKPQNDQDPKGHLMRLFTQFKGRNARYTDRLDAVRIIQKAPSTNRLSKVPSFKRLLEKLLGNPHADFVRCGGTCDDLAANN